MKVLIYVDASKEVGDVDHLKVFADEAAADAWFADNDPEGVAFEYDVIGYARMTQSDNRSGAGGT